ncbi:MAG: metal-sensitive transcriptional regulator [Actinomycetota bacterium]
MNASVQGVRVPETVKVEGCIGAEERERLRKRLRLIEGQVRGVQRMVREDAPCLDVLTQLGSIVAATEKVALFVLTDHAGRCIREAAEGAVEVEVAVDEISHAVERFLRV